MAHLFYKPFSLFCGPRDEITLVRKSTVYNIGLGRRGSHPTYYSTNLTFRCRHSLSCDHGFRARPSVPVGLRPRHNSAWASSAAKVTNSSVVLPKTGFDYPMAGALKRKQRRLSPSFWRLSKIFHAASLRNLAAGYSEKSPKSAN